MNGNIEQITETEINRVDNGVGNNDDSAKIEIEINRMDNDSGYNVKEIHENYSGRLVEYPSDSNDSDSDASTQERADPEPVSPHPTPGTPASPSPSPTQRRRNEQGEAVLSTFSSRGILYLLQESLRRENSIRQSALQRIIRDAGVFQVSQKLAGYMANQIKTWDQAKQAYNIESNGLAIFSCGAGIVNATDPYEMARL